MNGKILVMTILGFILLSGCDAFVKKVSISVSADPLTVTQKDLDANQACNDNQAIDCKKHFLVAVVKQSMDKCREFSSRLTLTENTVNTTGDILSTTLTALGTVYTPLTTVHALTAGATIVGGSKSSINANIYAKASISNLQEALDKIYIEPMKDYINELMKENDSKIDLGMEVMKIELIHNNCTLAEAENFASSTINNQPAKTAADVVKPASTSSAQTTPPN